MALNLSGRSFLTLLDFSREEIEYLLQLAADFKALKRTGTPHRYLEGKNIVLLFENLNANPLRFRGWRYGFGNGRDLP